MNIPLLLFSGMGADASVFRSQQKAFPELVVPEWIPPQGDEALGSYCGRLAQSLSLDGPCLVGGASFGGIVALEMTRHLDARGCILIGSVAHPRQIPKRIRMLRPFASCLPWMPLSLLQGISSIAGMVFQAIRANHLAGIVRQFANADMDVLKWSAKQILVWDQTYDGITVKHIHGDRDRLFPVSLVTADQIVKGGGHVISMTHAPQVNEFIRNVVSECMARSSGRQ